jgi:hypothetical protein
MYMAYNSQDAKSSIKQKMDRIQKSILVKDFKTSINLIISVYEEAFKCLFKMYLGQLHNPKQIIECLIDSGRNKTSIDDLMFGNFISFFNHSTFIEEVAELIHEDMKFDKREFLKNISELNPLRINDVHAVENIGPVAEEYVNVKFTYLNLFLRIFGLKADTGLPIEFGTLRTQKIVGEIQLYRSLNEVLFNEGVDCLDTTYFSAKIPQKQKYEEIQYYWEEINKRVHNQSLILRRVISLCDEDVKGSKLLWVLFDQIPKYFDVLNKSVFLSVFNASRIQTYRETSKAVNLINIIIMYSKETPNRGHVWLFSSHPEIHVSEREYLHVYGDNISVLRNIFNDLYNSSDLCDKEIIKRLISLKSRGEVNLERIYGIIDKLSAQSELDISLGDIENVKKVYSGVYSMEREEDDEYIF